MWTIGEHMLQVAADRGVDQSVDDLPENPQPVVTAYEVPHCRCQKCGKRVRGTAPGLAPDQTGATAHRVGPGLMAAAHALHYGSGVPVRKDPRGPPNGTLVSPAIDHAERFDPRRPAPGGGRGGGRAPPGIEEAEPNRIGKVGRPNRLAKEPMVPAVLKELTGISKFV